MTVNSSLDCDLISSFLDLGPLGTRLPVQLKIPYGLNPGSILFVTARCENRMCIKIKDDDNKVVQNLEITVNKNEIIIKDQCSIDINQNKENETFKARFSLTCVCEPDGYRIFINGKQVEFFKRNYTKNISLLDITDCQVYKIMYTTIIFDTKKTNGSLDVPTAIPSNNNDEIINGANIDDIKKEEKDGNLPPDSKKNNNEEDKENEDDVIALPGAE